MIFDYSDDEALGQVVTVDTGTVVVRVADIKRLRELQVNRLAVLQSSKPGQHLVGIIQRIRRNMADGDAPEPPVGDDQLDDRSETNLVKIVLIGTLIDREKNKQNIFRRTLETVPEIDANCFPVEGDRLTRFMRAISDVKGDGKRLSLGTFTLDESAEAFLNGNKLFQRHALIVGSTGSGKSYTTARLLDQISDLEQANAVLFDIHGEYKTLKGPPFRHFRIAGPGDIVTGAGLADGVLHVPYWLLGYEAMVALFVDRSDQNAPNQSMLMSRAITSAKRAFLTTGKHTDVLANFTIDSPVPFDIDAVLKELNALNTEMVEGARTQKQGDFHGKLSRLIARFEAKRADRRLGFLFQPGQAAGEMVWLETLTKLLIEGRGAQHDGSGGIKVIDFSEVPSDVLPLIVSLLARIVFSVQQWTPVEARHPIALFCDEAHLYIPERADADSAGAMSVRDFERVAKEGRKYGVGLVVISQRPAEVNRTVLSQCNNVIAMRLTNGDDQAVIRRLLPDSLGGFGDLLPILDTGEALVVGDASLLPTRVRVSEPRFKPDSATIDFWDRWDSSAVVTPCVDAVAASPSVV
jgi:hypothetical protein